MKDTDLKKNEKYTKKMQKTNNKRKLVILITIIILLIIVNIIKNNENLNNISKTSKKQENEETLPLISYMVYDNQKDDQIKGIITINSKSGIEYIEKDQQKINAHGRNTLAIDYETIKDGEYTFKIKEKGEEIKEETISVTDEIIKQSINIEDKKQGKGFRTVEIISNIKMNGFETSYQIGKNGKWINGKGNVSMLDYDLTTDKLINDNNTITISARIKDNTGNQVTYSKDYEVDTTSTVQAFEAESLLKAMEEYDFGSGKYKVKVSNETYNLKVYSLEGNPEIEKDTKPFGNEEDVGTGSKYAQNMVVLKVNGNLTINKDAILTAYASKDGYGGPKGMMIYCTGILTNNGTISMTAKGAKAEGQNVYLWKNADTTNGEYEFVPAEGARGGDQIPAQGVTISSRLPAEKVYGKKGYDVTNETKRATGGGGSGGNLSSTASSLNPGPSGAGAKGTSYSGGTGGGGRHGRMLSLPEAGNGLEMGGAGGNGCRGNSSNTQSGGGGAGNPGGLGANAYNWSSEHTSYLGINSAGANGTGGLLIIYSNKIINNGTIESNGSNGGDASVGGGSSGGGSINIFYTETYNNTGGIFANGGKAIGTKCKGGAGGTGSISIGNISTKTYNSTYKNY